MGILKKISAFIMVLSFSSCDIYEPISIPKKTLFENFKIEGYYYSKHSAGYDIYYFYNNGVVINNGSNYLENDLKILDQKLIEQNKIGNNARFFWGLYNIENKIIKIEKWVSTAGSKYPTNLFEGEIKDIDKFLLTKQTGIDKFEKKNKTVTTINKEYIFRQFSPKPDSTNNFIK
jgi:hypothetical protein